MGRLAAVVTSVVLLLAAGAGLAQEVPATPPQAGPGADAPAPKPEAAKKEDDGVATATLDQVLADLADAKFIVKRLDAAVAARQFQDARLTPLLVKLLRDESADVRLAAIAALGDRTDADQKKKAADGLATRLHAITDKVEFEAERGKVIDALHDLAQVSSIDVLLDKIGYGTSLTEVEARCRAVGNVPSPKAIEALIGFMQKRHRDGTGYRAACNRALQYATGERGTNDADMWRAWWKEHEKTFDYQAAYDKRQAAKRERDDAEARRERARERQREGGGKGKGDGERKN